MTLKECGCPWWPLEQGGPWRVVSPKWSMGSPEGERLPILTCPSGPGVEALSEGGAGTS